MLLQTAHISEIWVRGVVAVLPNTARARDSLLAACELNGGEQKHPPPNPAYLLNGGAFGQKSLRRDILVSSEEPPYASDPYA